MAPKRIVQDIVPSTRRSIRSVKPSIKPSISTKRNINVVDQDIDEEVKINNKSTKYSSNSSSISNSESDWDEEVPVIVKKKSNKFTNIASLTDEPVEPAPSIDRIKQQRPASSFPNTTYVKSTRNYSKIITFAVVFVCVGVIALALSLLYTKAVVTITPSNIPINVESNFLAKKDIGSSDSLGYQVVTINYDEFKTVPATDGPLVQTKSKGTITLSNSYSTTSQKILAGTKITSSKNLVYKTTWSVVIPGRKLDKGKIVPGVVDVGIVADVAGAEYDMSILTETALDFSIAAYKNGPRYTTITGRLKKDLVGGFSGKKKVISPEVEKLAYAEIEEILKEKLLKNIKLAVPDDLVMFDNAYSIEYQKLPIASSDSTTAKIGSKGTLYGIIFNSKSLINTIAKKQIDDNRLSTYKVDGLKSLQFTMVNSKDNPAKKGLPISFTLKGQMAVTGTFPESELKNKLVSVKLDQLNTVIKQYPSIKSVSVILTPFWMRRFPSSADNILFEYK